MAYKIEQFIKIKTSACSIGADDIYEWQGTGQSFDTFREAMAWAVEQPTENYRITNGSTYWTTD